MIGGKFAAQNLFRKHLRWQTLATTKEHSSYIKSIKNKNNHIELMELGC